MHVASRTGNGARGFYNPAVPTYAYIARSADGRRVKGRGDAANESAMLGDLAARGLSPIEISPAAAPRRGKRVGVRALAASYRQLSELLRSGVPLLRALRLLARSKSSPALAASWGAVADGIASGDRLADAMSRDERVFAAVHVAMVRAGERGAFLENVLARLATLLEQQADLRGRVLGNLLYPVVLLLVGAGVVVASLVFFVPKFEEYFSKMPELPLPTRLLLGMSSFVTGSPWLAAMAMCAILVVAWVVFRSSSVRLALLARAMRLPFVGTLLSSIAVARFARMLGTLLENGIPMLSALEIARESAGNPILATAIERAAESVRHGEPLAEPLAASGFFSEDVIEMISVGESANNLPSVLVRLADTLESRIDRMLATLLKLMEPAMLLLIACVVMFIFVALVVPMMRMSSQL